MRKKDLKARLPKKWPDHSTAKIIRVAGKKVLMILLPEWRKDCPKTKDSYTAITGLAHFVWYEGFLTYYRKYDYWTKESISWLDYRSEVTADNFDDKSYEQMRRFLGYVGSLFGVEQYEQETKLRLKAKYHNNKQKRIDDFMKRETPALPKDFRRWCTRKIGKKVKINVKLFQKTDKGMISRMFWVERYKNSSGDFKIQITEICRAFMDDISGKWHQWYYGQRYYLAGRRQTFWDRKGEAVINVLPAKYFVYDNLDSLGISPAIASCIRLMDGIDDPEHVAIMANDSPEYEQIVKLGLTRLATQIYSADGASKMTSRLKCLPRHQLDKLIKLNGGEKTWEMLKTFPKITDENLKIFNGIKDTYKADKILDFWEEDRLNLNHLFTLWKNTGGIIMPTINKYNDYIRMAGQLGNTITDEIIYRDKRWRERHDIYLEEINRQRAAEEKKAKKAQKEKWKAIRRDYERNSKIFGWQKDGYIVMVPRSYGEINEEGRRQHHCVGSQDQYKVKMSLRKSYIVFLRKAEAPNKPYYTIEVDENRVIQYYAAYDRQPDREAVKMILDKWMKQVRKNFAKEKKAEEICATSHKTTSVAAG